jgi:Lrp/AsnC family transcriptional regulator, leucine-responsive regulatory protein
MWLRLSLVKGLRFQSLHRSRRSCRRVAAARASRGFEEAVRTMPQIISADYVAGETDVMLLVVARDVAELQHVLVRLSTRGGQRLTTLLRLQELKPASPLPIAPT